MMSVAGRLFQARMWRGYAKAWDAPENRFFGPIGRAWVREILQISREECLRRARINVYLARRANRRRPAPPKEGNRHG